MTKALVLNLCKLLKLSAIICYGLGCKSLCQDFNRQELEIQIPPINSVFTNMHIKIPPQEQLSGRVSRSAGDVAPNVLQNVLLKNQSQLIKSFLVNDTSNVTGEPSTEIEPIVENRLSPVPRMSQDGLLDQMQMGTTITDNIYFAVAAATVETTPEPRCLEVVSECLSNTYYVAFADGGPQLYRGETLELQGYYFWDALGWYRLDESQSRAQYCTLASQIALYIDVAGDRIQSPRSEIYWSRESTNDTGRWCVHPTKLFHYRYFWLPASQGQESAEFFEDLDTGWRFESCEQNQGVIREFYEYAVRGVSSYNQLKILRC